jgi:hypothetical protein
MGIPGPAIPEHNSFCVHFLGSDEAFYNVSDALLKPFKVPVRHFKIESNLLPEEAFWKTTVAVVQMDDLLGNEPAQNQIFRTWLNHHARGECLLIAITSHLGAEDAASLYSPDLWIVSSAKKTANPVPKSPDDRVIESLAEAWIEQGAGAVAVFNAAEGSFCLSRNAVFGKSRGLCATPHPQDSFRESESRFHKPEFRSLEFFAAGLVAALMEELLGENLFLKTTPSLERACLEVRPLHLTLAAESGMATVKVLTAIGTETFTENTTMTLLDVLRKHQRGEVLDLLRQQLRVWRGPEPKAWGARGR